MDIRSARLIIALLALVVGCDSPTVPDPPFDPAIVTEGTVFTVESAPLNPTHPDTFRQGTIRHTFTNRTPQTLYIVNCWEEFEIVLERKVGRNWEPFWHQLPCLSLSPAIEIQPGGTYTMDLLIYGFDADSYFGPELAPASGPFRIRWADALVTSFEWGPPASWSGSIPEELRISNEFDLVFN